MAITNLVDDLGAIWMVQEHYIVLKEAVKDLTQDAVVLEIGTHKGRSAIFMLECNPKITLHCLDYWKSSYREFKKNIRRYRVANRIVEIKDNSINVANHFAAQSIDFVYLDGCHQQKCVKNDLINLF